MNILSNAEKTSLLDRAEHARYQLVLIHELIAATGDLVELSSSALSALLMVLMEADIVTRRLIDELQDCWADAKPEARKASAMDDLESKKRWVKELLDQVNQSVSETE